MTYTYHLLKDSPIGVWSMDSVSAGVIKDLSGFNKDATVAPPTVTNMLTNPSFETNASGWSQISGGGTLTRDTTQFQFGTASGKQVNDGTVTFQGPFTFPASPASPLTTYTASVYLRGNVGGEIVTVSLSRMPGSAGFATLPVTLTTSWQRFTVTGTTPSGTTDVYLAIYEPTIKVQTFFVDGAMIEFGPTASDYFDGSTTDTVDYDYSWTGTAHASTSQKKSLSTNDRPIVARGIAAQRLYSNASVTFPVTEVMTSGKEAQPFTLEAWVKPSNAIGVGNILSRNLSGIFIENGKLYFRVSSAEVSWEWLKVGDPVHIVGVYDRTSIYLYVNGQIVGSAPILVNGISDTATTLKVATASGFDMSVDSIAVYNYALPSRSVNSHYVLGTNYPDVYDLSSANGGNVYLLQSDKAKLKYSINIDNDVEFRNSNMTGADSINNELVNLIDTNLGTYAAGVWEYSIPLTEEPGVTLIGSSLSWNASAGVTVQVAVNAAAYSTISNGGQPFSTLDISTGATIKIKITLPAGAQYTVKRVTFAAYYSEAIVGTDSGLAMTITSPDNVSLDTVGYQPASFSNNIGMGLVSPSSVTIAAETNFGGLKAVEFTIFQTATSTGGQSVLKSNGGTAPTPDIVINTVTGSWTSQGLAALIIDGVSNGSITPALNTWHHVIAIFSAANASSVTLANGMNCRLGYLAVYPANLTTITAADAQNIYKIWAGAPALSVVDGNVVTIREYNFPETSKAARGYAYDWSIKTAG